MIDCSYILRYLQGGDRILLYGKGKNGQKLYKYLREQTQFCIVGIVARNADQVVNPELPMYCPDQLKMIPPSDYDKIIITVLSQEMGMEICQIIRESGIDDDKIVAPFTYIGPIADISVKSFTSSPLKVQEEIEKFISNQYRNLLYFDTLITRLKGSERGYLLKWGKEVVYYLSPLENIVFLYILYLADIFDAKLMKCLVESALQIDQPELRNFLLGVYNDELSITFLHEDYLFPEYYILRRNYIAQLCEMYDFQIKADKIKKKTNRSIHKILVLVGELSDNKHSPTLVSVQLCKILEELGYEVVVMPLDNSSNIFWEFPVFSPIYNLASYSSKKFEDYHKEVFSSHMTIEYIDIIAPREKMQFELDKIVKFSPDLIVDMGTQNSILSYVYSKIFPTLYLSTAGGQSSNYFTFFGVHNHDMFVEVNEIYHSVDYKKEVVSYFLPMIPKVQNKYERDTYPEASISKDDFILISVGNRIGKEMKSDFIDIVCRKLLVKQNIKWLIVGGQSDYLSQKYSGFLEANKIEYIAYEDDLPALYQICDVYISPKRQGGGTSAFWAMYYGIPVVQPLSIQADTIAIIGTENAAGENYEQMAEYVLNLWGNSEKYAEASDKMRKRALYIVETQKQSWKGCIDMVEEKLRNL